MAKLNLISAAVLTAAFPLVAGCTSTDAPQASAEALTPKQAKTLEKQLAGKVAGDPVRCLSNYKSLDTVRVSDNILLYRQGRSLVYRNDLRNSCPGLARDTDIMVVEQFGSSTCNGDLFHLVDRGTGMRGPTCVFGDFVPYRKPAGDAG